MLKSHQILTYWFEIALTDDVFITKLSLVYVPYKCSSYYAFYLYYK